MRKYSTKIQLLSLCLASYLVISILTYINIGDFIHLMMAWNVFLAFIPLLISMLFEDSMNKRKKLKSAIIVTIWLLFFPNSPYMLTDFIHISETKFYFNLANPYLAFSFNTALTPWIKIVHIGIGVFFGVFLGMFSMYIVHISLIKYFGRLKSCILMVLVSLLSGYAIYIGRFLRFNSWDILKPRYLFIVLQKNINLTAAKISLLFGTYVFAIYVIFYLLNYVSKERE